MPEKHSLESPHLRNQAVSLTANRPVRLNVPPLSLHFTNVDGNFNTRARTHLIRVCIRVYASGVW